MRLSKELSATIDVARFVATVLVVAIHYNNRKAVLLETGTGVAYLLQEFVANGLARVAVPYFALASGFFAVRSLASWSDYKTSLLKRRRSLLLPYLLGSALILIASTLLLMVSFPNQPRDLSLATLASTLFLHPASGQYWYLRDLMLLSVLAGPFAWIIDRGMAGTVLLAALFVCWLLDLQFMPILDGFYLINVETLFFFYAGAWLVRRRSDIEFVLRGGAGVTLVIVLVWLALLIVRMAIDPTFDCWYVREFTPASLLLYKLGILVGIAALLRLSAPLVGKPGVDAGARHSFFVYLYHLVPLSYFRFFTERAIPVELQFFVDLTIALVVTFAVAALVARWMPVLYGWMTGGRAPVRENP